MPSLLAADVAFGGVDAGDLAVFGGDAFDLALLDDVHAHGGTGAGVAPGDGVMAGGAAAGLVEGAEDGVAGAVDVDDRDQFFDAVGADVFGGHTLQHVGVDGAQVAAHLVVGLGQHQQAAGGEHDVVVQVLAEGFVQAAGLFVDRGGGVLQVVRADDGGVAPGVAAAEPAFFDDRDVGDAVVLAKVVGGGKAVAACADDDGVVGFLRQRRCPGPFPTLMVAEGLARDGKYGIAFHGGPPRVTPDLSWNEAQIYPHPTSGTIGKFATFADWRGVTVRASGGAGISGFCLGRERLDKRLHAAKEWRQVADWGFWIAAGGMGLAVAASLIAALFQRRRDCAACGDRSICRFTARNWPRWTGIWHRGMLTGLDAERLRAEISRRILEADRQGRGVAVAVSPTRARLPPDVAIADRAGWRRSGAMCGWARRGIPICLWRGGWRQQRRFAPPGPAKPWLKRRRRRWQALMPDAEMAALMVKLRQAVLDRPGDVEGLSLLARNEAALGNLAAAGEAQTALIAAKGKAATGQDHVMLAEIADPAGGWLCVARGRGGTDRGACSWILRMARRCIIRG